MFTFPYLYYWIPLKFQVYLQLLPSIMPQIIYFLLPIYTNTPKIPYFWLSIL